MLRKLVDVKLMDVGAQKKCGKPDNYEKYSIKR
jgi:hypothetical protein